MPLNNKVRKRVNFLFWLKMPEFRWHRFQVQKEANNTAPLLLMCGPCQLKESELTANMLAHSRMNPFTRLSSPYHHETVNQTNTCMKREAVAENEENKQNN